MDACRLSSIVLVLAVAGCNGGGGGSGAPSQPSMAANAWHFQNSTGMSGTPSAINASSWQFSFPQYGGPFPCTSNTACPNVDYLVTAIAKFSGKTSLTVSGNIAADNTTVFDYRTEAGNTCSSPAAMRLYIERKGNDMTQDYYRWWSNPQNVVLKSGAFSITVSLTADQWSSVYMHRDQAQLNAAINDPLTIGMTFGGGCFFSHGVNIRGGNAVLKVTGYRIN